jgi:F0F1-type ATP synthase membrane subunit b/b'
MTQYETELSKARKEAKLEISTLQKLYQNIMETELRSSQKNIDEFLITVLDSFHIKKDQVLFSLENEIDSLSTQIITKLLA